MHSRNAQDIHIVPDDLLLHPEQASHSGVEEIKGLVICGSLVSGMTTMPSSCRNTELLDLTSSEQGDTFTVVPTEALVSDGTFSLELVWSEASSSGGFRVSAGSRPN